MDYRELIRDVPDFPKPGIIFKDITPLLAEPSALHAVVGDLTVLFENEKIDLVLGAEARGFIFAAPVALRLNAGFVPVRKPGKLPWQTESESFELEYGQDSFEIHRDAIPKGSRVLIVDDLLATGGTAEAMCRLVERLGGQVAGLAFVIELDFLNGRNKLKGRRVESLIRY